MHTSQYKERPAKSRRFLLALIVFIFLMDTGLFISNMGLPLAQFHWAGDTITDNTPPLEDRLLAADYAPIPYNICADTFEIVNVSSFLNLSNLNHLQFIIGDGIVIWRATALWPHSSWIKDGLYLLFLGDIGMYCRYLYVFTN